MSDAQKLQVRVRRSQLGRARGLGSAKSGTHDWWLSRLTAVALVPLTLWFIASVMGRLGAGQAEMIAWLTSPVNAALMIFLIIATFHHLQLGLQVVIEDYIHDEPVRLASVLVVKGLAAFMALACIVSVLKLAFFFRLA